MLLFRATINSNYSDHAALGDMSFYVKYIVDPFLNWSSIHYYTYNFYTP